MVYRVVKSVNRCQSPNNRGSLCHEIVASVVLMGKKYQSPNNRGSLCHRINFNGPIPWDEGINPLTIGAPFVTKCCVQTDVKMVLYQSPNNRGSLCHVVLLAVVG